MAGPDNRILPSRQPAPSPLGPVVRTLAVIGLAGALVLAGPPQRLAGSETAGSAHPFVATVVDAFVNRTRLTLRVSSSADELDLIHGIIPDEAGQYDTAELREGVAIHADFLLERFEVYDPAGNKLAGKLVETGPWEIPAEGILSGRLVDYMLNYTFEYAFDEPPEYLTFQNNIIDYNFSLPSEVKLLVKQSGSDVPYAANLKLKVPETVRFDWDKPLKRQLTGPELRAWFDETREKTLGLTSYGGVYSFIYITPREIRHEVLVPLANLAEFIRFRQADKWYLEVEEQDLAQPQIEEFFSGINPVRINGKVVQPRFDRIDFAGLDVRDFGKMSDRRRVSLANGRVGVIMSFPTRNLPDELEVTWDKFSSKLKDVDVIMIHPDDKVEKFQFSKYLTDNTVTWTNPGIPPLPDVVDVDVDRHPLRYESKLPKTALLVGALLACGVLFVLARKPATRRFLLPVLLVTGLAVWGVSRQWGGSFVADVNEEDAAAVFSALHTNLFRAFDYHTEEAVYDALAQTTHGPLLREIYLEMRRSLEVKEQGGAVSRIDRIEILDGEVATDPVHGAKAGGPGFPYLCTWELAGTVEHWGHIHRRTNRYEALFQISNVDGLWKFTAFQPLDEQQGPVVRTLRKF